MIFRSRVFVFLLTGFCLISFAQSPKSPPQASEDKQTKKTVAAQPKKPAAKTASTQPAAIPGQTDEKIFSALRWRQVGPFRGGRVLAVTGVPGEPNVFYFGGASSGVWKSTDAGTNWQLAF